MPETSETVALPSALLLEATDNDEVDELPSDKGILTVERRAGAVQAEALVTNVAAHATTVSPAAWLLLLSSGDARSTTCCKLQLDSINCNLRDARETAESHARQSDGAGNFRGICSFFVEPTAIDEVDELPLDDAGSLMSANARPLSKSVVLIPAKALAAAIVANVASQATTVSPAAWLPLLQRRPPNKMRSHQPLAQQPLQVAAETWLNARSPGCA